MGPLLCSAGLCNHWVFSLSPTNYLKMELRQGDHPRLNKSSTRACYSFSYTCIDTLVSVVSVTKLAMGSIHYHSQHYIFAECFGNLSILISEYDIHFDLPGLYICASLTNQHQTTSTLFADSTKTQLILYHLHFEILSVSMCAFCSFSIYTLYCFTKHLIQLRIFCFGN